MVEIRNIGVPQVANRAFVALAIEAGIEVVIRSLVGLADDKVTLLISLKTALYTNNPALADALNTQTLDAILNYMALDTNSAVLPVDQLPALLNRAGPAETYGGRDSNTPTQVNFSYTAPPENWTAEAYLDGVFVKHSTLAPTNGYVYDILTDVAPGEHTVRVLYRSPKNEITRFGTIVTIS
jgi:hypothetical protein